MIYEVAGLTFTEVITLTFPNAKLNIHIHNNYQLLYALLLCAFYNVIESFPAVDIMVKSIQ